MRKGQLIVMLLAVMIIMTLVSQNLKKITPLVSQFASVQKQNQTAAEDAKLLKLLGAQDLQAPQYQHIQKIFSQLAGTANSSTPILMNEHPELQKENSLFKDWMDAAIKNVQTNSPFLNKGDTPLFSSSNNAKPFIQITPEFPPEITNPNFTPRQLRSARIRLREMRLNYQDTAKDVRFQFGAQAEEKVKQAAAQAEQKAVNAAQTAENWDLFEKSLQKINAEYEAKLKQIIQKHLR